MRLYRLLTPANRDLAAILEYLYEISPAAADRFLTSFDRRLALLATQPHSGHRREEFGHPELRYITLGMYVIAYDPDSKPLAVVAIVHGSRDLDLLLKGIR